MPDEMIVFDDGEALRQEALRRHRGTGARQFRSRSPAERRTGRDPTGPADLTTAGICRHPTRQTGVGIRRPFDAL